MEGIDLSKVCRLCLKGEEVMCPIFGVGASQPAHGEASLPHRIMSCAQVKLAEGDGLPNSVCASCLNQVDRSYQFKLLCERSDSALRASLKSEQSSDTESLEGEPWDMNKFTPEVIIKEDSEENNLNGGYVEQIHNEFNLVAPPLYPIATIAQDSTVKQDNGAILLPQIQEQAQVKSRRCRGGDKLFKCRQCNKSYSFSSALSRHKAVHNTALRPHVCQICNKGFTQVDKLLRHQKTHTMDTFLSCDLCNRPFKSFPAFQKHKMSEGCEVTLAKCGQCASHVVEGEAHICTQADAQPAAVAIQAEPQSSEDAQEQDARRPTGKGRPEFKCTVCMKNFATRGSLEVHSTIHTGVRPFVCSVCDKSFRHKVNLMEHFQRKHSQVRPYICDVCAARFVTKQELVRHYKKHIGD
ncbi:zinc finger protein 70-like [Cimex lectularius]|uniref:Uncharacterized protein n=1 Tax=Cimex lectularius TaxID=79782 RepID=A0A8I6RV03_CIMLE|nr:zinc finger protein 70-like [Cimex lectularius]